MNFIFLMFMELWTAVGRVQSEWAPKGASDPLPFIAAWTSEKLNSFLMLFMDVSTQMNI